MPPAALTRDVFKYFYQEWSEPPEPEAEQCGSVEDAPSVDGSPNASTADTLAGCENLGSAEGHSPFAGSLRSDDAPLIAAAGGSIAPIHRDVLGVTLSRLRKKKGVQRGGAPLPGV